MPASIEVTLSNEIIDAKDTFTAEFNYSGNLSNYYYVENGVSVIKEKNSNGIILFELTADKNECNFVLRFALNGTEYQLITIYTYSTAGKVFISDSSEDTAWLMGLTYKLEQGIITEAEAEAERNEYSRKYAEETVTVEQTRGTSYAQGTLTWTDHNGVTRPLRQNKIEVCRDDIPMPVVIAITYTDNNGYFYQSFDNGFLGGIGLGHNIFIRVPAASRTFEVSLGTLPLYFVSSSIVGPTSNNQTYTFNMHIAHNANSNNNKAFQVAQGMVMAQRYAMDVGGMNTNKILNVTFPVPSGITSFCWNTISGIGAGDYNRLDVLLHEYGHFVSGAMGNLPISLWDVIVNARDFMHSGVEDHFVGKTKDFALDLAWMESWASAFALMAYSNYSTEWTSSDMVSETAWFAGYNPQTNITNGPDSGEAQERAVISFLWDLFGSRNTNMVVDAMAPLGHMAFWQMTMASGTTRLYNFVNNMSNSYPQFRSEMGVRMGFFKIAPQIFTLTNTPSLSTPPSFSWRVNGSQNNPNNQFRIGFYNASGVQVYETGNLSFTTTAAPAPNDGRADMRTATATLTQQQWETALTRFVLGSTMNMAVKGYLNTSPTSGPYWSSYQTITAPGRYTIATVSGGVSITGVIGTLTGSIAIPASFDGQYVVAIGNSAFANQTQLSQISIPASVTSIGDSAFMNCTNLQNVSLVSGLNLTNTPNHTTSYSNYYYTERSLDVNLVAGTTYTLSFDYSNLNATTDLTNVFTSLGVGNTTFAVDLPVQKPFSSSSSGSQVITFTPTAAQLATSNKLWCRFIRTSTPQSVSVQISNVKLQRGVTSIAVNSFAGCTNLATPGLAYTLLSNNTYAVSKGTASANAIFIPSIYNGRTVSQINASGFKDNNFRWVFMQAGLTTLGNRAFQFCSNLETGL